MSSNVRLFLVWLGGGTIAFLIALVWLPAVYLNGQYLPSGHDSFYHAARILEALDGPWRVQEFDPRIHAPDGGWVHWPWGYDSAMAAFVRSIAHLRPDLEPMAILVFVPPVWVFVNVALVLGIVAELRLSLGLRILAVLAFSLSPLTQNVHGAGRIDHHFMELFAVLGILLLGLKALRHPSSAAWGASLGVALGLAPAIHNGLFVLYLPLIATLFVGWLKGTAPSGRAALALSIGILAGSIAVLLPSAPFQSGLFTYYLLSWFHLYAAFASVFAVLFFHRLAPTKGNVLLFAVVSVALCAPLAADLQSGSEFIWTAFPELQIMPETKSVFGHSDAGRLDWVYSTRTYSALVWLVPIVIVWLSFRALRSREPATAYFAVFCILGAAFMLQQFRFHHFGSFTLYLPILLAVNEHRLKTHRRLPVMLVSILVGAAYVPCLASLSAVPAPGFSYSYMLTRPIYGALSQACADEPGVVLADHGNGHYIRYHTDCSVISNTMILTREQRRQVHLSNSLLALEPSVLLEHADWIRYVYVERNDNVLDPTLGDEEIRQRNAGLRQALLFAKGPPPPGFQLLGEIKLDRGDGRPFVLARAFRLEGL